MENGLFIDDFPIKTTIYRGFSMAMLNNQMVDERSMKHPSEIGIQRGFCIQTQVQTLDLMKFLPTPEQVHDVFSGMSWWYVMACLLVKIC